MKKYTKIRSYRFSEVQDKTLIKMKSYGVDIGKFVRDAVAEKIKRDYHELIPNEKQERCPFSGLVIKKNGAN